MVDGMIPESWLPCNSLEMDGINDIWICKKIAREREREREMIALRTQ